jgi:hypothetical protein
MFDIFNAYNFEMLVDSIDSIIYPSASGTPSWLTKPMSVNIKCSLFSFWSTALTTMRNTKNCRLFSFITV